MTELGQRGMGITPAEKVHFSAASLNSLGASFITALRTVTIYHYYGYRHGLAFGDLFGSETCFLSHIGDT